jgi:NADH dehydrogenase FAD-containing subunit
MTFLIDRSNLLHTLTLLLILYSAVDLSTMVSLTCTDDPYEYRPRVGVADATNTPITSRVSSKNLAFANSLRKEQPKEHTQHLVLIGGGHAHVQVIKALNAASRPSHLRVTLVDAVKSASYSGLIPGCVAGYYTPEQTLLHLEPLAAWASIDFIHDKVTDIDLDNKRIYLESSTETLSFDAVSVDIGSTSRDLYTIPGAAAYTIPTRPIHKLIERLEEARQEVNNADADADDDQQISPELVVIGGGAAGIELSLSVTSRWKKTLSCDMKCTLLLDAGTQLLPQARV